jgi:hypothetical protein
MINRPVMRRCVCSSTSISSVVGLHHCYKIHTLHPALRNLPHVCPVLFPSVSWMQLNALLLLLERSVLLVRLYRSSPDRPWKLRRQSCSPLLRDTTSRFPSRLADTAAYFERILPSLSASTHPRFVVIALRNLVGVFDDEDSALTAAADVRGEPLGALCVLHVDVTGELIAEESCAHVHQPLIIPASGIPRPQVQHFPSDLPDVPAISINVRNRGRRCLSDHYVGDIR